MRIGLAGVGRIGAFHAETLTGLDFVDELVVTDLIPEAARSVADKLGVGFAETPEALLASDVDAFVITTSTSGHAALRTAVAAGVPTFCEKPVAATLDETVELVKLVEDSERPGARGFQRRFDAGYRRAGPAVQSGELGFVHTVRANTHDQSPPPADYVPTSGGLFRDCSVHDFDILRFVTGREVATVYAVGANKGARSSPRPATSTPGRPCSPSTTAPSCWLRHEVQRRRARRTHGGHGVGRHHRRRVRRLARRPLGGGGRGLPARTAELVLHGALPAGVRRRADRVLRRRPPAAAPAPAQSRTRSQAFRVAEACERSRGHGPGDALDEIGRRGD